MRIIKLGVILSCVFLFTMSSPKKKNLNVVFISGSNEYVSHITLKEYKQGIGSYVSERKGHHTTGQRTTQ